MSVSQRPDPTFEAPWHAQVFALTVHLNELGYFTWPDWVEIFSAGLRRAGLMRSLNGGDDYFEVWLATLERILAEQGHAEATEVAEVKSAWEKAYLATPHGAPVHLKAGFD